MRFILFTTITILLSACSMQRVSYQTGTSETQMTLPDNNKSVVIINRVRVPNMFQFDNGYATSNSPFAINGAISGLRGELNRRKYFTISANTSTHIKTADGIYPDSLDKSALHGITRTSDIAVSLEMFGQNIRDDYTIEIRKERIADRVYKEVDYYVGRRTIQLTMGWRLYSTVTGEMLDEQTFTDNYYYEGEALSRMAATQLLENNFRREMTNLGAKYGREYAAKISPINFYTYREIYDKGNSFLEKGSVSVRAENWEEAEEIWSKGIKGVGESNRKKLAKLYHNLAVASERKGDLEQAKEYAKLAANQHPIGVKTQSIMGY
jgi:tetratricopeptide (TPR) repeat protein